LNLYAIQKRNAIRTIVSLRVRSYSVFVNTVNRNMIVVRKRNGNFFLITTVLKDQQDLSKDMLVPRALAWWAGFWLWSIALQLYLKLCKSYGHQRSAGREIQGLKHNPGRAV